MMNALRHSNSNKRQKTETEHGGNYYHDEKESLSSYRDGNSAGDDNSIVSFSSSDSSLFDIFDELEAHPNAIQLVASSGGLVTHWNEAFSDITHKSSSSLIINPITIFDLVDSKSIPSLYGMLAMALHNVPLVEEEIFSPTVNKNKSHPSFEKEEVLVLTTTTEMAGDDDLEKKSRLSSLSHLSITLPCKSFHNAPTQYNITIVFVDATSLKRCFLGILIPRGATSQRKDCSNSDIDRASCLTDGGSFCAFASTSPPSNNLTQHTHDTIEQRGDCTKQTIKSLTEEPGAAGSATPLPQIPCGKVLRIDDDFLCQILFDSK